MAFLGYSGRGRGRGGGGGRGRGWGRNGGSGRSIFPRPYAGGRGRGRFSFQQQHQSYPARGGNVSNSSHKWVRKENETNDVETGENTRDEKSKQENNFVKRGRNQLILRIDAVKEPSNLNSEKQEESSVKLSMNQGQKIKTDGNIVSGTNDSQPTHKAQATAPNSQMASGSIGGASDSNYKSDVQSLEKEVKEEVGIKDKPSQLPTSMPLKKVAPNKLVVSSLKRKSNIGNANSVPGTGSKESSAHLTKIASNKLVAPGALQKTPVIPAGRPNHYHGPSWTGQRTKKRPPPMSRKPHPSAKRIAIEVTRKAIDANEDSNDDPDSTANGESSSEHTEKLTDFAYRETSKRVQRGNESKSLKWSANGGNSNATSNVQQSKGRPIRRNMGLVRVQPNMDKTPVCKKFLRGIICTDQYCKKRHDVPKEFAMPICSFFQRHGNCLKGRDSCPFRHIKVNPRAMVCPSFAVLGFCDDPDCKMKHERTMPKKK